MWFPRNISRRARAARPSKRNRAFHRAAIQTDVLEPRIVLASTPMAIGMNLDNVRDYLPNWMFSDAFQQSRPWISHEFNTATVNTSTTTERLGCSPA